MQLSEPINFYDLREHGVSAKSLKIAIVRTEFNNKLVNGLEWGAKKAFSMLDGDLENNCQIVTVPGAVEIPLVCQKIFQNESIDAIVAIGVVIRGDTNHFDYVCQMCSSGIMKVMLNQQKPISFGVLTTENFSQAEERCQENDVNKGIEAMLAAIKLCCLKK
jgi:6,7-dimethyl-8-ribityllumazine synthase